MKPTITLLLLIVASFLARAQSKKFSKQDSIKLNFCNCDSVYKKWPPKPKSAADIPDFEGNGWNKLYNFQNNVGQCGYFNKFYFIYGLQFKYDEAGKLIKINKFYNGKLTGICGKK